jgi:hypothetical protein
MPICLPTSCDFDPDGDVTLALLDHGSYANADLDVVKHIVKEVSNPNAVNNGSRAKRSLSGSLKDDAASPSTDAAQSTSWPSSTDLPHEIQLKVSSKHLTFASPVFKALLRGGFSEDLNHIPGPSAIIRLPEDDPAPLWLLLYIIHGQLKKVPPKVNLRTLTRLVVLIDKYQLHEATGFMTDSWFGLLEDKKKPGRCYSSHELRNWICISWVLRKEGMFAHMTHMAMLHSQAHLAEQPDMDLPVPGAIFGKRSGTLPFLPCY